MRRRRPSLVTQDDITTAKIAKSINWNVVENWRNKLGASCGLEMAINFDTGYYYDNRMLNRGPFHRHVRINLDKMLFTGCYSFEDVYKLLEEFRNKGGKLKQLTKSEDDEDYGDDD